MTQSIATRAKRVAPTFVNRMNTKELCDLFGSWVLVENMEIQGVHFRVVVSVLKFKCRMFFGFRQSMVKVNLITQKTQDFLYLFIRK